MTMTAVFGAWSLPQIIGGFILVLIVTSMWCLYRGGYEEGFEAGRQSALDNT